MVQLALVQVRSSSVTHGRRRRTDEELVLYIYGAPAEQAEGHMLEDPGEL